MKDKEHTQAILLLDSASSGLPAHTWGAKTAPCVPRRSAIQWRSPPVDVESHGQVSCTVSIVLKLHKLGLHFFLNPWTSLTWRRWRGDATVCGGKPNQWQAGGNMAMKRVCVFVIFQTLEGATLKRLTRPTAARLNRPQGLMLPSGATRKLHMRYYICVQLRGFYGKLACKHSIL